MKTIKFADIFCLLAVMLFLAGCATNRIEMTYYSDPAGATIYSGQSPVGYTPFTLAYNIRPEDKDQRFLKIPGTKVVWATGVSTEVQSLTVDRNKGSRFHFVFVRPDVPGRQIDVNFAVQLERNRILQQQAEAQQDQAFWQMYNTMLNQYRQSYVPTYSPTFKSFNCTSRQVGNYIYTDCY